MMSPQGIEHSDQFAEAPRGGTRPRAAAQASRRGMATGSQANCEAMSAGGAPRMPHACMQIADYRDSCIPRQHSLSPKLVACVAFPPT